MSGLINKLISDGTVQFIGSVPECEYSLVDILVVNPTNVTAEVRLWSTLQDTPSLVDTLDHSARLVAGGGRVGYDCLKSAAFEKFFVQAPAGCVVRMFSIDKPLP